AVVGVSALVESVGGLQRGIEVAGALFLLWLGVRTLRQAGEASLDTVEPSSSRRDGFAEGFFIAFLNPKIAIFFLALLGSFLPPDASLLERGGVATLAMVIDASWYMFAALLLAGSGAASWLARNGVWVDRLLAVLLLSVAGWLLLFGGQGPTGSAG
ncbi:MAG: LysE family transporter, partial [Myxococcota bacterium]|nr:LysE family transporter [Myxococcota bacterium]